MSALAAKAREVIALGLDRVASQQAKFDSLAADELAALPPEAQAHRDALAELERQLRLWSLNPESERMPRAALEAGKKARDAANALTKKMDEILDKHS